MPRSRRRARLSGAAPAAAKPRSPRRGTLAALVVAVAVVTLYVVLQPVEAPERRPGDAAPTTATTVTPTTTLDPIVELCALARQFEQAARGRDLATNVRLAEPFYDRARRLAPPPVRPEYDAAVRYYAELNDLGTVYGYDHSSALASRDGQRWFHLAYAEPLGVPAARANVAELCQVELPPPPTSTTTTTATTTTTTTAPPTTAPPTTTSTTWPPSDRDDRERRGDRSGRGDWDDSDDWRGADDDRGRGNGRGRGRGGRD